MSFAGKVVLITGGSSGIGAATAVLFAKEDADVVIVGRNQEKLDNVAEQCSGVGKTPFIINVDITNDDEAKMIVFQTVAKYGKLDVLVNNAGVAAPDSIVSVDLLETFDRVMKVNLRSVLHITSLAAPHLIRSQGCIVNVSSSNGSRASSSMISYSISKAGLNHFTNAIALELADSGVRVNTVSPGPVETDIIENCGLAGSFEEWGARTPLKKASRAEEVAEMIVFLASEKAGSVTGANVAVDNGVTLKY